MNRNDDYVDHAINILNSLFKADPNAMYTLQASRIPTSLEMADHPLAVVDAPPLSPKGDQEYVIGMTGVINALMTGLFDQKIATAWETDNNGNPKMIGFTRYTNKNQEVEHRIQRFTEDINQLRPIHIVHTVDDIVFSIDLDDKADIAYAASLLTDLDYRYGACTFYSPQMTVIQALHTIATRKCLPLESSPAQLIRQDSPSVSD